MDGLKDALSRYHANQEEDSGEMPESQSGEKGSGASGGKVHAVHHHDHGEMHSKHHIMQDGTAKSETHKSGEGGEDCPMCGGSGKTQ